MLMAPYNASGSLCFAATLSADSVMNGFLIQQTRYFEQYHRFVEHEWRIKKVYVSISDQPGRGTKVLENFSRQTLSPL